MTLKRVESNIFAKSSSYVVRVKDIHGRWYPIKSFKKITDARRHKNELLLLRSLGKPSESQKQKNITLSEYWSLWTKTCRNHISEGWRKSQLRLGEQHLLPIMGFVKLKDFRNTHVGELMAFLETKGLGDESRRHVFNLIRKMMQDAVEEFELLDKNPVTRKHKPRVLKKERPHLKPDEVLRLLDISRNERVGPAIWLACLCGLRSESVMALRWKNVFLEQESHQYYINVCEAYKRKTNKIELPKGKRAEIVPVPKILRDYLLEIRGDSGPEEFVCKSSSGGMFPYKSLLKSIKELCVKLDINPVSTHALRHSSTELYIKHGATVEDIRRLLHHKSPQTTMGYIHRSDERLFAMAEKLSESIEKEI